MNYLLLVALLRHYRFHPWQLAFNLTGIGSAICLLTAVDLLIANSRENFAIAVEQLSGQATHHITSPSGLLPEQLYTQLVRRFSVAASPIIQSTVRLSADGEFYTLLGVDLFKSSRFQQFITGKIIEKTDIPTTSLSSNSSTLVSSRYLLQFIDLSPPAIIISRHHAKQQQRQPGDKITLHTIDKVFTTTLMATFTTEVSERFDHLVIMDIGQAQRLLNVAKKMSRIDLTINTPEQLSAIRLWLPSPYQLTSRSTMARQLGQISDALSINLSALTLLVVATGFFIVFNTIHFSLLQRQSLFIQLTQLGIPPQQKALLLLLEISLLAIIATGLGVGLGILASIEIQQVSHQTTENLYGKMPVKLFHLPHLTLIKAALIGIISPLCITAYDSWQTSRLTTKGQQRLNLHWQPSQLLGLCVTGVLLISCSFLLFYQSTGLINCFIAIGALLVGYAVWIPIISWFIAQLAHQLQPWPTHLMGVLWQYFWQDNLHHGMTTSIAMMALVIALAAALGIGVMVDSFRITVTNWLEQRLSADIYLQRQHWGGHQSTALPIQLLQQLSQHPAVTHIAHTYAGRVTSQGHSFRLSNSNMPKPMQAGYLFTQGNPNSIWQQWQQPNQLLISEPLANRLQLQQYDQLEIDTPKGKQIFTIAGIYYDYTSEYGRALISVTNYTRYWPASAITSVAVYLANPSQQQDVIRFIRDQWGKQLNLMLSTPEKLKQRSLAIFDQTFLITNGLRTIAIIIAVIGMVSTLMALQLSRTHEFMQLQQLGFTYWQINLFQLCQMIWFGSLCCLLAIPIGYGLAHWLITGVNIRAFGWSMPLLVNWSTSLPTLFFTIVAVGLACLYPIVRPPRPAIH